MYTSYNLKSYPKWNPKYNTELHVTFINTNFIVSEISVYFVAVKRHDHCIVVNYIKG